jgi:hypothetical protein
MHYRITVNGSIGSILSSYPAEQWGQIAETYESRGLTARLERRLVTDTEILELVPDTAGYIRLGDRVACPWEIIAEML